MHSDDKQRIVSLETQRLICIFPGCGSNALFIPLQKKKKNMTPGNRWGKQNLNTPDKVKNYVTHYNHYITKQTRKPCHEGTSP